MSDGFATHAPGQQFVGDGGLFPNFKIPEYLKSLNIEFKRHESGGHTEFAMCCKFCVEEGESRDDIKYRLWINSETGEWNCYNCNIGGSLQYLVQKLSHVDFYAAIKILVGRPLNPMDFMNLRLELPNIEPDEGESLHLREIELPHGFILFNDLPHTEGIAHEYLKKRGIPLGHAIAREWGYSDAGFTLGRIIVPTFMEGQVVFWQARATWEPDPGDENFKKVLNPSGVSAKGVLYNYDGAKDHEEIVIVEGFMDAAKIGIQAVATNGKRLHEKQVEWLTRTKAKSIVMMYDRDAWMDGRRRNGQIIKPSILRAADMLKPHFNVRLAVMPDNNDPGSYEFLDPKLQEIIHKAKPY